MEEVAFAHVSVESVEGGVSAKLGSREVSLSVHTQGTHSGEGRGGVTSSSPLPVSHETGPGEAWCGWP